MSLRVLCFALLAFYGSAVSIAEYSLYTFDESIDLQVLNEREIRSHSVNADETRGKPYVILVSLDGCRYDYPELHEAANLLDMMEKGSYARSLIPSFPSKTFPNHYTIATGLYPAHHGLVGNTFFSRSKGEFYSLGNRDAVKDGPWYGGTPLWNLAVEQGMNSASFFWAGSIAPIDGTMPSYTFEYNAGVPYPVRIEKVKQWLELPEDIRPHLIMLYFSATDSAGHQFGPTAPETGETVRFVDGVLGELRRYIKESELPINLIVTADHGMTLVTRDINVRDYVDLKDNTFVGGPMSMIYTKSESETQRIYAALQGHADFECYLEGALPSYLNFSNADRIGDVVLITGAPNHLEYWEAGQKAKSYGANATHGFDPYRTPEMGAVFIAEGPGIKAGQRLSPFENIHIYPFVAELLQLDISEITIDGRPEVLAPLLKE